MPKASRVSNAAVATLLCRAAALEWLAATAWNAAIQGGEAKLYRDTAVLLCSAGKFYAAHPMPETSTIQYQMVCCTTLSAEVEIVVVLCYSDIPPRHSIIFNSWLIQQKLTSIEVQMAFLMSASSSLEGATKESEDTQVEMCYGLAQKMLLRYTGAAQALADRRQSLAEPPSKAEDKQHVYKLIMVGQSKYLHSIKCPCSMVKCCIPDGIQRACYAHMESAKLHGHFMTK